MSTKQAAVLIMLVASASPVLTAGPVESTTGPTQAVEKPWSFNLSIYGWGTAVDGTISAGVRSADVDIAFKDIFNHLDMGFMGSAELRYKRWGFVGELIYARL